MHYRQRRNREYDPSARSTFTGKSARLERPFEIPIDTGHEKEPGNTFADSLSCNWPEQRGSLAPGSLEDLGQNQHRHVAADSSALSGNPNQFTDHRLLQGGVGIVELERIRPAGEIRTPAIGQDQIATRAFDPRVILRSPGEVMFCSRNEIVRMIFDPSNPSSARRSSSESGMSSSVAEPFGFW